MEFNKRTPKVGDVVFADNGYSWGRAVVRVCQVYDNHTIVGENISVEHGPDDAFEVYDWTYPLYTITGYADEGVPVKQYKYVNPKYMGTWAVSDYSGLAMAITEDEIRKAIEQLEKTYNRESLKEKTMRKLSELSATIRRAFSKDQKDLWRAGYIDECGKWSEKAITYVNDVKSREFADAMKEDILAIAREEIEVEESEKE
jgi:hypothetical protein